MVQVRRPPPAHTPHPVFHFVPAGALLVRVFRPHAPGDAATTFRTLGPLARFDHHRHPDAAPADDPARGMLYAAPTLSCCVVEVFGDTRLIAPAGYHVGQIAVTRNLTLLDLRGSGAMRAGSVAALAKVPDHALAREWSRHFYEQPAYGACDGLLYSGVHNDEDAVALYERAAGALSCPASSVMPLDDPALRGALLQIAADHDLYLVPYSGPCPPRAKAPAVCRGFHTPGG